MERMLTAYSSTVSLSESRTSTDPDGKEVEHELEKAMSELKKAQDALAKALERRKVDLLAMEIDLEEAQLCIATCLSENEMEQLIELVKNADH